MPATKPHGDLTWLPIQSLRGIDGNPQVLTPKERDALRRSIERDGFVAPVLVRPVGPGEYEIVSGNHRVSAAKDAGLTSVPVVVRKLSDLAARRVAINLNTIHGDPSATLLAPFMADLDSAALRDVYLSDEILSDLKKLDLRVDRGEDDVPEVPNKPVSSAGDLWVLGSHRLLCGDATVAPDVNRVLGGVVPHLMVTDPPYGVSYDPAWRRKAGVSSARAAVGKVLNDDRADWREAWALFPGSVAYVWHSGLYAAAVTQSLTVCHFEVRAQIVWVKTRPALSRGHYHWQHEPRYTRFARKRTTSGRGSLPTMKWQATPSRTEQRLHGLVAGSNRPYGLSSTLSPTLGTARRSRWSA